MSGSFLNLEGDKENRDMIIHGFRALVTGQPEIEHLGREWRKRSMFGKEMFEIPTYLQAQVRIIGPDDKNRCKVQIELPHLAGEDGCHTVTGYVVTDKNKDNTLFFFNEKPEYKVRLDMVKQLLAAGVNREKLKGIFSEKELGAP